MRHWSDQPTEERPEQGVRPESKRLAPSSGIARASIWRRNGRETRCGTVSSPVLRQLVSGVTHPPDTLPDPTGDPYEEPAATLGCEDRTIQRLDPSLGVDVATRPHRGSGEACRQSW